jgi:hypothetical protein
MWAVVIRGMLWALAGVGVSDIATDWFKKREPDEAKPDIVKIIAGRWIGWAVTAGIVVLILKYTNILKKRL